MELYINGVTRRITNKHHKKLLELMDILNAAAALKDLHGVSDFHPLKGCRKGEFSMHVNGPWCITFEFKNGDVTSVNYEQYH